MGLAAGILAPRNWDDAATAANTTRDFAWTGLQSITQAMKANNENASARRGSGRPSGGGRGGRGGYVPVVRMATAETASIQRKTDVIGRVRAQKSITLSAEVTGIVDTVNIAPGQRVSEGDVLLQIDDDEQQVALARAQADYPIAKENAERYRDLESDAAASELEAEQAQNAFTAVRAQLRAAEFAVEQRKIRAPFNGIVGITEIEAGDYLRAGDLVASLDDTSSIIIEFSVPQESAAFVNIGQPVTASLTSGAGIDYDGTISAVDSRVDSQSRTLRVEARVDNSAGRLIPGAVVAVSTTSDGEPAISVPGLSVQWDRLGAYVWRRNGESVAERVGVVILQRNDNLVLVEGDLNPGDAIVSEGADRVRRGVPLPGSKPDNGQGNSAAANASAAR